MEATLGGPWTFQQDIPDESLCVVLLLSFCHSHIRLFVARPADVAQHPFNGSQCRICYHSLSSHIVLPTSDS